MVIMVLTAHNDHITQLYHAIEIHSSLRFIPSSCKVMFITIDFGRRCRRRGGAGYRN
jgi:hypothetical protein